jgi:hypothetical protein
VRWVIFEACRLESRRNGRLESLRYERFTPAGLGCAKCGVVDQFGADLS